MSVPPQGKVAGTLVVINQIMVVDLGQAQAELVKMIVEGQQEIIGLQESSNEPTVIRSDAERILSGTRAEPSRKLLHVAAGDQCFEVPIDRCGGIFEVGVDRPVLAAWHFSVFQHFSWLTFDQSIGQFHQNCK